MYTPLEGVLVVNGKKSAVISCMLCLQSLFIK
jgi:hypothetical protein